MKFHLLSPFVKHHFIFWTMVFGVSGCVDCEFTTYYTTHIRNTTDQSVQLAFTWEFGEVHQEEVTLAPSESKTIELRHVQGKPRSNKITTKRLRGTCPSDQTQSVSVHFTQETLQRHFICLDGGLPTVAPAQTACSQKALFCDETGCRDPFPPKGKS